MDRTGTDFEIMIWTPLIGFDMDEPDCGVEQYYDELGFVPDKISLFLFSPDIIHLHEGLQTEQRLPVQCCNYYGNVRNEKRAIQPWTNLKLRKLVQNINARGTEVYAGIMGVYFDTDHTAPTFPNNSAYEWMNDHKELMLVRSDGRDCINVLKRFTDGSYYQDFLLEKLKVMLTDYGMAGLHTADGFCPQTGNACLHVGDFSDDMIAQFTQQTGIRLPQELTSPLEDNDFAGIKARADYIWNRLRREWIEFYSRRWFEFWKTISGGLHEIGKKTITNNAWCSEPFEALYRFGIDYKALYEAGVNYIVTESQAAAVNSSIEGDNKYRLHQYMTMPMLMRAYAPEGNMLCISGVKDSTEEWNAIEHLPSAVEREIYVVANMYVQEENRIARATDGICVCLGDGITAQEWKWQRERWDIAFTQAPEKILAPTLLWSDSAVHDFLDEYIKTRRWSFHKTVYEIAERGAQFACISRIENLPNLSGAVFVPNADLLPEEELAALSKYDAGPVICTAEAGKLAKLPGKGEPDIYFEDPISPFKLCLFAYGMPSFDYAEVLRPLGEDDGKPYITTNPKYAPESPSFLFCLTFQKMSTGFVEACATVIRTLYADIFSADPKEMVVPMQRGKNLYRLFVGNENRLQYYKTTVRTARPVKKLSSKSKFPALPAKLLNADGDMLYPKSPDEPMPEGVYGFIVKTVPGGLTILDVELED